MFLERSGVIMASNLYIAGGCFWGVEAYFRALKGVIDTKAGYAQSNVPFPTYEGVCSGKTGAVEAVEITYDKEIISLETVLEHMFRFVDPVSLNKQGNDVGTQYRSGIYYEQDSDRTIISSFLGEVQRNYSETIVVEVEKIANFYVAEEYHQKYLEKNPRGYCHVNLGLITKSERK